MSKEVKYTCDWCDCHMDHAGNYYEVKLPKTKGGKKIDHVLIIQMASTAGESADICRDCMAGVIGKG